MSLISVIIPAYDQARYLDQAIASVLAQTYASLELIVVDDGSTDETPQCVARFRDDRLRYIYQANRGLAAARNTGLRAAWGRFVSFLDADDLFLPTKLADLVRVLSDDDSAGLAAGQAIPIDTVGRPAGKVFDRPLPADGADLLLGNPLHVGSVLLRASWIEQVGPFDETLRSYEDWDLWLRLALAGCPMRWVPRPVSLYRFHPQQMTRDGRQMTQANLTVLDNVFANSALPEPWRARRDTAYSHAYLRASANAYLGHDFAAAGEYLRRAVDLDPSLMREGGRPLADRFSAWTELPKAGDPIAFLEDVYHNLPTGLHGLSRWQRQEVGKTALRLAIESHRRGDVALTRQRLWRALRHQPGWIARRGVASILVRSFLPTPNLPR